MLFERSGDQFKERAEKIIGQPIAKIELRGCMASERVEEFVGTCLDSLRCVDPMGHVIWENVCVTADKKVFRVISARCFYNDDLQRWEETY